MAYTIPVAALLLDEQAAAAAINKPPDYFKNPNNNRQVGIDALSRITGAPVERFADEDEDIYYLGLRIYDDWRIDINPALLSQVAALKSRYPHELVQSATLAVVSEFC